MRGRQFSFRTGSSVCGFSAPRSGGQPPRPGAVGGRVEAPGGGAQAPGLPVSGEKGWKNRLWQAILRQGEERRQAGDCFLDGDWPRKAKKARLLRGWCLTGEGVEVSLPQCAASPAAEGCPVFTIPLEK